MVRRVLGRCASCPLHPGRISESGGNARTDETGFAFAIARAGVRPGVRADANPAWERSGCGPGAVAGGGPFPISHHTRGAIATEGRLENILQARSDNQCALAAWRRCGFAVEF